MIGRNNKSHDARAVVGSDIYGIINLLNNHQLNNLKVTIMNKQNKVEIKMSISAKGRGFNKLNAVKVEQSFRVNADTTAQAANLVSDVFIRDTIEVTPLFNSELNAVNAEFLVKSSINTSVYYDVFYVDSILNGKYRVETGSVTLNLCEYLQLTGGDDAVNSVGFYQCNDKKDLITVSKYDKDLLHWISVDKNSSDTCMELYFKNRFNRVVMINGSFEMNITPTA